MKKTKRVSMTLLSLAANLALAAGGDDQGQDHRYARQNDERHDQRHEKHAVSAPEVDPGQAMGALVLLGGAVAILRGYRRKK